MTFEGRCGNLPGLIDSMFVKDHFPKLRSHLVAALATLDVDELTHGGLI